MNKYTVTPKGVMMTQLERFLSGSAFTRRITIVLIIILLGWIDLATGYEYSFAVFYLIPISIAAWFDNPKITVLTILAAGGTWLYADFGSGHQYTHAITPIWNALVRLTFFSVVAYLLFKVRGALIEMTKMAMKDSLTALNNSRAFQLQYQDLHKKSHKSSQPLAIGLIDLDGFKKVNDTHGHSKGDDVLVEFAKVLKSATRSSDIIARMGGDEFVVVLKNTDPKGAQDYANRLRSVFEASGLKARFDVDFSMGISIFNQLPENLDEATHKADLLMYQAKELGKAQTAIRIA
jgi:diguanylate cyclase (GGDEF)-like protein